jgi:hypothetical protein
VFKKKYHFQVHRNKKFPCDRLFPKITHNNAQKNEVLPKKTPINAKKLDTEDIITTLNNNECYHCHKIFTRKYDVERHLKKNCRVVKEQNKKLQTIYDELHILKMKNEIIVKDNEDIKKDNKDMKKEINELKSQLMTNQKEGEYTGDIINSNSNNTNNNNTINSNNIIIVACGKEDMNKINPTLREILFTLKKGWQSPEYLINKTHFNSKFPEYQNVFIPDIKNKFAMIHNGDEYVLRDTNDVISELYDRNVEYIEEKFAEYGHEIPKSKKNALNELIKLVPLDEDEQDKEKKEMVRRLFENIKLLLYNKRKISIKTRDKMLQLKKE